MKLPWEKKHLCWAIVAFVTFAASVLFYMILKNWNSVWGVVSFLFNSIRPVIYGLVFAYLLNPLMNVIEKKTVAPVVKKIFRKKAKERSGMIRGISIFITWIIVCLFVFAVASIIIPELVKSIKMLVREIPNYANHVMDWFGKFLKENPDVYEFFEATVNGAATNLSDVISKAADAMPNVNSVIADISSSVYEFVMVIIHLLIGIVVSVYVLKDKEKFMSQSKKLAYSVVSVKKANKVLNLARLTHEKFGRFLVGQIFDSIAVGIVCFIALSIFKIPYSALIGVIVGITNVIPFFGPFIGAVPSALLLLMVHPMHALYFLIFILILQQFDGNILGPKILGDSTGLASFWVLFAILVGGGLFGFIGMVLGVPVFAVIYAYCSRALNGRLKQKGFSIDVSDYKVDKYRSGEREKRKENDNETE